MNAAYQEKMQKLTAAIENKTEERISIYDVQHLREQLLNLKHSGETFKSILRVNKELDEHQTEEMDRKVVKPENIPIVQMQHLLANWKIFL